MNCPRVWQFIKAFRIVLSQPSFCQDLSENMAKRILTQDSLSQTLSGSVRIFVLSAIVIDSDKIQERLEEIATVDLLLF